MVFDDVVELLRALPGVDVQIPGPGSDAPEIAQGDAFAFVGGGRMPFATVVTKDYPGDASSRLGAGRFRVNVDVGRARFAEIVGYPPVEHSEHDGEWDYAADDSVVPHPVYANAAWVSVTCPTEGVIAPLVTEAYARAAGRGARVR
ncbi:DUF6194 family protein [Tsukamurella sp. 8F]|uniref:DUF6194 family protein n=1 Tax=unclassified Tsukamurella TaxID=2633480 RepID=UPI0023B8B751|nr:MULTISPECIES: DUF6194 family protein [unclassified Tsukamurella]MDF0529955.1 DUF6194 family protein [Tsukamurella sp. 8J]MDF0587273.1 DUF6194 family protein [Tsukamurella sp. 8F]